MKEWPSSVLEEGSKNIAKCFNYQTNVDCEVTFRNGVEEEKAIKQMLKASLSVKLFWRPLLLSIFKNPAGLHYDNSQDINFCAVHLK